MINERLQVPDVAPMVTVCGVLRDSQQRLQHGTGPEERIVERLSAQVGEEDEIIAVEVLAVIPGNRGAVDGCGPFRPLVNANQGGLGPREVGVAGDRRAQDLRDLQGGQTVGFGAGVVRRIDQVGDVRRLGAARQEGVGALRPGGIRLGCPGQLLGDVRRGSRVGIDRVGGDDESAAAAG